MRILGSTVVRTRTLEWQELRPGYWQASALGGVACFIIRANGDRFHFRAADYTTFALAARAAQNWLDRLVFEEVEVVTGATAERIAA